MKNTKIITISIIVIILLIVFIFIFNKKTKQPVDSNNSNITDTQNTLNKYNESNINNTGGYSNTFNQQNTNIQEVENIELKLVNSMNKNLSEWLITKDQTLLIKTIDISAEASNEALYEPWIDFLKKNNSNELVKLVYTQSDKKSFAKKTYFIFQWVIEGSGEFENFTSSKKQELKTNYQILKKEAGI